MKTLEEQIAELQLQLRDQQKMASLGLLSAGIAHEIQNPLNFVINFSKMSAHLLDDLNGLVEECADRLDEDDAADLQDIASDLKQNMEKIQEHGERAISIIRGILLQSRGKEGEFLPTDVPNLVHEYVWLSYHAMRANDKNFNISIHEEYPEQMPQQMVIPQDLSRAVLNVINNACYTVRERCAVEVENPNYKPTISVKVSLEADTFRIDLQDNGMGMSEDVQQKLFHAIFTTKPIGQGTGLGMNITHQLITDNLKGQLLVCSKVGEGTTFSFIIPAKPVK